MAIPVGAVTAAAAVLMTMAAMGGYDPFVADTWARWDSAHYRSIAADGYELEPCPSNPSGLCGNAGWFPAYPWLMGLLAAPGASVETAGLVVAWLFALGIVLLLRRTFLADLPTSAATGGIAFAAFVPGAVYHHAVFPLSMFGFFAIAALWLSVKGRWAWAGASGAVAAASYHLGLVLIPLLVIFAALSEGGVPAQARLRRAALVGGIAALGPLVVIFAMWLQTGAWDAFLLVHDKYDHGFHSPAVTLDNAVSVLFDGSPLRLEAAPALQKLFVTLMLGCVALDVARRRATAEPAEWLLLAASLALWLLPLTQHNAGLYRTAAALVVAAPLVARLPTVLLLVTVGCAGALTVPVTILFLEGEIV